MLAKHFSSLTLLLISSPQAYSWIIPPLSLLFLFSSIHPAPPPPPPPIFSIHVVLFPPASSSLLPKSSAVSRPSLLSSFSPRVSLPFCSSSSHYSSSSVSWRPPQGPRPARLQCSAGCRAAACHPCLPWVRKTCRCPRSAVCVL